MMPRLPSRPVLAAYFSLAAVVGCGASVTGATTGATGMEGVSDTSGGGAAGGAGGGGAGGMAGGSGVGCQQCACVNWMWMGGCFDACSSGENGQANNFCEGLAAPPSCAACLMKNCPSADPNDPSTCM